MSIWLMHRVTILNRFFFMMCEFMGSVCIASDLKQWYTSGTKHWQRNQVHYFEWTENVFSGDTYTNRRNACQEGSQSRERDPAGHNNNNRKKRRGGRKEKKSHVSGRFLLVSRQVWNEGHRTKTTFVNSSVWRIYSSILWSRKRDGWIDRYFPEHPVS